MGRNFRLEAYTYVNKKAEIFNKPFGYLIGNHIWTEFPEGVGQNFQKLYAEAMATQEYRHIEEYYPPNDKWFENYIYPSPTNGSQFCSFGKFIKHIIMNKLSSIPSHLLRFALFLLGSLISKLQIEFKDFLLTFDLSLPTG